MSTQPGPETAPAGTPAPAPGATPPDAKPAPKPGGLVRWGVLIFLIVAVLGFAFIGAGPVAKWAVQKYGSQALGAPVTVESAKLDVFGLALVLTKIRAADAKDATKDQFTAEEVRAKIDPIASLKGQLVIAEAIVSKPRGRLVRNADGSINGGPTPEEPPPGTPGDDPTWKKKLEEKAKGRDLVEDVKNLAKKLKERHEARKKQQAEEKKRRDEQGVVDFHGRAEYVRGGKRPAVVVRLLKMDGVEIRLEDAASGAPAQTLTETSITVREWSTAPTHHDKPMEVNVDGKLLGAPGSVVKLDGKLDVTGEDSLTMLNTHLENLPLAALDALYRNVVPVEFRGKSIGTLDLPLSIKGGYEIDWRPAVTLDLIEAAARDPNGRIAGVEANKVAEALTKVGKVALRDVRIHGPIWSPTIEGDVEAVKQLLAQAGMAYASKEADKRIDQATDKATEELNKRLGKNEKVQEALDKSGAGKVLEGAGKDANTGAKDAAKGAIQGLFGGSSSGSTGSSTEKK